jgi:anti-sigma factor RsiW
VSDYGDMACQQFVELVTDFLEDQLGPDERRRFEEHLSECPGCADYLDQIRATQKVLGTVSLEPLSAQARDQLLTAFRSWRSSRGDDPSTGA